MSLTDIIFNYGISIFVLITVFITGLVFYKIGYLYGHQRGWREGLYRGSHFGRWKLHENRFPDSKN